MTKMKTDSPAPAVYPRCRTSNNPFLHMRTWVCAWLSSCIGTCPASFPGRHWPHNVWHLTMTASVATKPDHWADGHGGSRLVFAQLQHAGVQRVRLLGRLLPTGRPASAAYGLPILRALPCPDRTPSPGANHDAHARKRSWMVARFSPSSAMASRPRNRRAGPQHHGTTPEHLHPGSTLLGAT